MCNIDAEALYLGIRHATYGKDIEHSHKCTKCEEVSSYNIDIDYLLNKFPSFDAVPMIEHDGMKIFLRPLSIESMTKVSLVELEQTKIIRSIRQTVENDETDEETLAKKYYNSFLKIAQYNVNLLAEAINYIETDEGTKVEDKAYINEFIDNVPSTIVDMINTEVKKLSIKPLDLSDFEFVCPECGNKDKTSVEVNPVNFSEAG